MLWKLTQAVLGRPEIDVLRDDDITFGVSLLREMAREDPHMHQVGEGRYLVEKDHYGREA